MAGEIIIKDGSTTVFTFTIVKRVNHIWEVSIDVLESDGQEKPSVDHNRTVKHIITVDFELTGSNMWSDFATVIGLDIVLIAPSSSFMVNVTV